MKARIRRNMWRERGCELARLPMRFGATGRAGAGGCAQQRVVGARDETLVARHLAKTFDQDHSPGREAKTGSEAREECERLALQLAKGNPDQRAARVDARRRRVRSRRGFCGAGKRARKLFAACDMSGQAPSPVVCAA